MAEKLTVKELKSRTDGKEMDLSLLSIAKVPVKEIASISKATSIDLSCNLITTLPDNFCTMLKHIVKLDLSKNKLTELPNDFGRMEHLQHLDLFQNKLTIVPVSFCHLRNLKWLDLKDNCLDPVFAKVVGDCLDDKQCKKCAINVVSIMKTAESNLERERQKLLQEKREKEAKEIKEAQKLANKKKHERKLEKERKRKEWELEQERKRLEAQEYSSESDLEEQEEDNGSILMDKKAPPKTSKFGSKWNYAFVALLAVAVGAYFYCDANKDLPTCKSFNLKFNVIRKSAEKFAAQFQTILSPYWRIGKEQVFNCMDWMTDNINKLQQQI